MFWAYATMTSSLHAGQAGIEVRRFEKLPAGFVDRGVVQASELQDWPTWDVAAADELLTSMRWRRLHPWIDSAGTRVAQVERVGIT